MLSNFLLLARRFVSDHLVISRQNRNPWYLFKIKLVSIWEWNGILSIDFFLIQKMHWILFWGFVFVSASLHTREAVCCPEFHRWHSAFRRTVLCLHPQCIMVVAACLSLEPGTTLLPSALFSFQIPESIWQPPQSESSQAMMRLDPPLLPSGIYVRRTL